MITHDSFSSVTSLLPQLHEVAGERQNPSDIKEGGGGMEITLSNNGGETWDYQNRLWGYDARAGGNYGGFSVVLLDDERVLVAYFAKADRSVRFKSAYEYGKMRLELAWLKKVRADSVEGRMR